MKFKASEIAELVCGEVEGNSDVIIHDFSKIEQGREGTLTFLANPKYEEFIYNTKASVALVNKDFTPSQPLP
ncbi:MAG: LpxD N-terminal domain-containing protein, partial [Bacteroidota bacterium]|nr:LpxD N-terminal domain-containing protein [Bacteroidota bacterium]